MDGTLIEHTWQLSQICQELYAKFAQQLAPVTVDEFFDLYWTKSADMWHMMVDGIIDGELAARYGYANTLRTLGLDENLAEPMLIAWRDMVLEEAVPFEDTYNVLDAVRKTHKTGILTNGFQVLQRLKINKYRLADHVDFTLVSEEAGYHKPDPRIFEQALGLADCALPAETLYVGDNPVTDIQGALNAGITPILMNAKNIIDPPSDVIKISRLTELLDLLGLDHRGL
jgi:HAD superfamily hydrolase (TIGR01549 family)